MRSESSNGIKRHIRAGIAHQNIVAGARNQKPDIEIPRRSREIHDLDHVNRPERGFVKRYVQHGQYDAENDDRRKRDDQILPAVKECIAACVGVEPRETIARLEA